MTAYKGCAETSGFRATRRNDMRTKQDGKTCLLFVVSYTTLGHTNALSTCVPGLTYLMTFQFFRIT